MIDDAQLVQSLLQAGLVDQSTIKEGLRRRGDKQTTLYEVLLQQRLVNENDLIRLAASILNLPTAQLDRTEIEPDVLALVPNSMATRNRVLPIQVRNERGQQILILGMADPLDMMAMDEVATHTGIDIRPVLVGPLALEAALQRVYARDHDDLAGIGALAMDVLEDANWAEFFDSATSMGEVEDSSVISQEMRERPTTDVFEVLDEDVDGLPSLDVLELVDLNDVPKADESVEWEADEVATSKTNEALTRRRKATSEIVSASKASDMFPTATGSAKVEARKVAAEEEDDEVGEPTMKKSLEELSEHDQLDNTGSHTQRGVGSDGEGTGGLAALRPKAEDTDSLDSANLDDTGGSHTSMGVGVREMSKTAKHRSAKAGETDYGALGRQILKTKTPEDDEAPNATPAPEPPLKEPPPADAKTALADEGEDTAKLGNTLRGVGDPVRPSGRPSRASSEPRSREITHERMPVVTDEDDLDRKPTNKYHALQPREASGASVLIPEGVDTRVALEVVMELLVRRGVLDAKELELLLAALKPSDR